MSASSTFSLEEVAQASKGGPKLLCIDARLPKDVRKDLIQRAAQFDDFKGIILDAQYYSNRVTENEWKNDFAIPPHLKCGTLEKYRSSHGTSDKLRDSYGLLKDNEMISVDEVKNIKNQLRAVNRSDMKVVVKGIMCKEDALQAMSMGADAIYVSNGCHLRTPGVPCTISVLGAISKAVRESYPQAEILIDSGVRRGTDVMKCLAYGANAVVLNRPVMWGLHFNGQEGIK